MAHDIDQSTGKPAIAYVGDKPWHGLGEKLPEGQPIWRWLKAARLDWELKREPVLYAVDGRLRTMDDRFVLVRSDTDAALSVVSGDYETVQPKEVLEFYRDLAELYGYTLETAGALNGGRKVWALAKTGTQSTVGQRRDDPLAAYVLLATSYDKTLATTAAFTSIRVVCRNTLSFAVKDIKTGKRPQIKIPHSIRFDAEYVKKELGLMDQAWSEFIARVEKMTKHPMKAEPASLFFSAVLGRTESKQLSNKTQREHATIKTIFDSAPGQQLSTAKETLWGAVNAVSYYVDHVRSSGDRLDSAWFGSGCELKEKAWAQASALIAS
jgi:phage/plasmid-like protein (TIGR03299 family)